MADTDMTVEEREEFLAGLHVGALHRGCLRRFRGALEPGGEPLQTVGPPVRLTPQTESRP